MSFPFNITNPGIFLAGTLTTPEQEYVTDLVLAGATATEDEILTWKSGAPSWEAAPAVGGYTNLNQFVAQTAWRIFYSNGSGDVTELAIGASGEVLTSQGASAIPTWSAPSGSGTVTSASVVSANGFAGTVATATTTPAITLSTTITGILKGNGTAISAVTIGSGLSYDGTTLSATGGGTGTVTDVSVVTANGVSGSVATSTTTPAITLTLGAITPTTVNGLLVSRGVNSLTNNISVGVSALAGANSGVGGCVAIGTSALEANTSGRKGVAVGSRALKANTTGHSNIGIGEDTLLVHSTGDENVAVGTIALANHTGGSHNVALGSSTLYYNLTGARNVALGYFAGAYETGSDSFYVNNRDQTNTAGDKANSLLYGTFNATPASQTLKVNATLAVLAGLNPVANDGAALGTSALQWSDLFLAEGGVINFDNGDITVTQTGNVLAVAGGDLRVATADVGTNADSVPTLSSTNTLTNKRVTKRVGTTTSSATPTINTDNVDAYHLTAQTEAITSFTTNLSGTPTDFQQLRISVTGTAARAITWGSSFANGTVALPTTTVTTTRLDVLLEWDTVTSKWRCMASGSTV